MCVQEERSSVTKYQHHRVAATGLAGGQNEQKKRQKIRKNAPEPSNANKTRPLAPASTQECLRRALGDGYDPGCACRGGAGGWSRMWWSAL